MKVALQIVLVFLSAAMEVAHHGSLVQPLSFPDRALTGGQCKISSVNSGSNFQSSSTFRQASQHYRLVTAVSSPRIVMATEPASCDPSSEPGCYGVGHIILGVDIGGTSIKAAPVDTRTGSLLADKPYVVLTPKPATPQACAEAVKQCVDFFNVSFESSTKMKNQRRDCYWHVLES